MAVRLLHSLLAEAKLAVSAEEHGAVELCVRCCKEVLRRTSLALTQTATCLLPDIHPLEDLQPLSSGFKT